MPARKKSTPARNKSEPARRIGGVFPDAAMKRDMSLQSDFLISPFLLLGDVIRSFSKRTNKHLNPPFLLLQDAIRRKAPLKRTTKHPLINHLSCGILVMVADPDFIEGVHL